MAHPTPYWATDADGNEIAVGDIVIRARGKDRRRGYVSSLWHGLATVVWADHKSGRLRSSPITGTNIRIVSKKLDPAS